MRTQPETIIGRLEQTSSRLDKESILAAAHSENLPEFFEGLTMALDPLYTFGIKQVPTATVDGQGLAWGVFVDLAKQLHLRELTGHAARDAVALCMSIATTDQWNMWYRRILIKDLRCGVSEKTVNKVVPGTVPVFTCQLAHDSANHEKKLTGPKQLENKLDGVRVLAVVRVDGRVDLFSRNGREFHNFGHIAQQLSAAALAQPLSCDTVFDGEVMSASFQDLMKQVHRKENASATDAVLHLFDMVPLADFQQGAYSAPQHARSSALQQWTQQHSSVLEHVSCLSWETVDLDTSEGQQRFVELNKLAVQGGYEGLLIKDPGAPYECKRSHAWLKLKPFIEVTLTIDAVEEGTGKNEGKLGAFSCSGTDNGQDIRVNVGSGFTDDQRTAFWNDRAGLLGKLVEVRADAVTQNQDGSYSLRFPRFKTFRGFSPGEKI